MRAAVVREGHGFRALASLSRPLLEGTSDPEDRILLRHSDAPEHGFASEIDADACADFHGARACVFAGSAPRGILVVLPPATYGADPRDWWAFVDLEALLITHVVVLLVPPPGRDPLIFCDHVGGEAWASWIADELLPGVSRRFRVPYPSSHDGIVGFSTGGLGALLVGLQRPDAFGAVVSMSPDAPVLDEWLIRDSQVRPRWLERARIEHVLGERGEFGSYSEAYGAPLPFNLGEGIGDGGDVLAGEMKTWNRRSPLGLLVESPRRNALRLGAQPRFALLVGRQDEYDLLPPLRALARRMEFDGMNVCWLTHSGGHTVPWQVWPEISGWMADPAHRSLPCEGIGEL